MKIFIISTFFLIIFFGCKEDEHPVPHVRVEFVIYPNSPEYGDLQVENGSAYLIGGYSGIIVFRKPFNEFAAYDRACTYDLDNDNAVVIIENPFDIIAVDTVCGSQYNLLDGSVFSGPATFPLKEYSTYYSNGELRIYN